MTNLPAIPVGSHHDATLNFEWLQRQLNAEWKRIALLGFEHGWENYEASERLGEYRRVLDVVELRGIIKNGENGKSAFILPEGYRPVSQGTKAATLAFMVDMHDTVGVVRVEPNGEVTPLEITVGSAKVWTYLNQVRFSVS